jgi:hypothetical protein
MTEFLEWGYGRLQSKINDNSYFSNPVFSDYLLPNNEIEINGKGKIIMISYICTEPHLELNVNVDNKGYSAINNVFCIQEIKDDSIVKVIKTVPNDYLLKKRYKSNKILYNVTFKIPFIFDNNIKIKVSSKGKYTGEIFGMHIYYLTPFTIKSK